MAKQHGGVVFISSSFQRWPWLFPPIGYFRLRNTDEAHTKTTTCINRPLYIRLMLLLRAASIVMRIYIYRLYTCIETLKRRAFQSYATRQSQTTLKNRYLTRVNLFNAELFLCISSFSKKDFIDWCTFLHWYYL